MTLQFCNSLSLSKFLMLLRFLPTGIFYLLGMILYPAGWGAERVQRICGSEANAFYLAECSLGSKNVQLFTFSRHLDGYAGNQDAVD